MGEGRRAGSVFPAGLFVGFLLALALTAAPGAKAAGAGDPIQIEFNHVGFAWNTVFADETEMTLNPSDGLGTFRLNGLYTNASGDFILEDTPTQIPVTGFGELGFASQFEVADASFGTYDRATGAMTLSLEITLTLGVNDVSALPIPGLGTGPLLCRFSPVKAYLSTGYGWPAAGDPFTPGTFNEGSVAGAWTVKPGVTAVQGSQGTCALIGNLLEPVGGIWLANKSTALTSLPEASAARPAAGTCPEGLYGYGIDCFDYLERLEVKKGGPGNGMITSNPDGISCGATCSGDFVPEETVTLTASAAEGSTFTGWSGACTGEGSCEVTMDQARTVTAGFTLQKRDLAVSSSGTGSGRVISPQAGIDCGDCSVSLDYGTELTLNASPATGSTFVGWSGACSGAGPCQVTMTEARAVTAEFSNAVGQAPKGRPRLANLLISGKSTARKGRKAIYRVTLSNTGETPAESLTFKARIGRSVASKRLGDLAAGESRTIPVLLNFSKKGRVKIIFTVTSANAGTRSVKKTVTVR